MVIYPGLIRNQQVVGSNPTGGSRKSSRYKALKVHFGGHSVDLPLFRVLSEVVKVDDTIVSTFGLAQRFIDTLRSTKQRRQKNLDVCDQRVEFFRLFGLVVCDCRGVESLDLIPHSEFRVLRII